MRFEWFWDEFGYILDAITCSKPISSGKKEAQNDLKILIILYKLAAGGKKSGFTVGIKPLVRGISLRKLLPIGTYFRQYFNI